MAGINPLLAIPKKDRFSGETLVLIVSKPPAAGMAIMAIPAAGGFEAIRASVSSENLSFLGIKKSGLIPAISLAVSISVGILSVPSYRQRLYTAKNISVVKKGFYISAIAYFLFSTLPVIIGLSASSMSPDLTNNNMAFPFMATSVLPMHMAPVKSTS